MTRGLIANFASSALAGAARTRPPRPAPAAPRRPRHRAGGLRARLSGPLASRRRPAERRPARWAPAEARRAAEVALDEDRAATKPAA